MITLNEAIGLRGSSLRLTAESQSQRITAESRSLLFKQLTAMNL